MKEIKINELQYNIGSLDIVLKGRSLEEGVSDGDGYTVLIKGLPGSGKTTMGLQLINNMSSKEKGKVKIATLLESPQQIDRLCRLYGFDFDFKPEIIWLLNKENLCDLDFLLDGEEIKYLMIDGISILKYLKEKSAEKKTVQERLYNILEGLKKRRLFTIIVSEEHLPGEDIFFEYIVDGVINLSVDEGRKERYLEINKLRWKDFYPGKHGFKLQGGNDFQGMKRGVYIFPSISCYFHEPDIFNPSTEKEIEYITSGINGFDKLIQSEAEGAFSPGEVILLIGEPGSGKTIFGFQFLNQIGKDNQDEQSSQKQSLCVSLDNTFEEIEQSLADFKKINEFIKYDNNSKLVYFNSAALLIDEFTNTIVNLLKRKDYRITRVLIDSISSLRGSFQKFQDYTNYISSLIRVLKNFRVTTILTYEIPNFFRSIGLVEIPNSTDVDTIISLRHYDINNALERGLVILKTKGKEHTTKLLNMDIKTDRGLYVEESGWSKIGLLGGEIERTHEAKLFFKFFYQNKSHEEIHVPIFDDFKKRYAEDQLFKPVLKNDPSPDHWSFKGYHGAGHSNTKLLSVKKYVMDVLKRNECLTALPDDVLSKYKDRFKSFLWNTKIKDEENPQMLPYYADIGVLVFQNMMVEVDGKLEKTKRNKQEESTLCVLANFIDKKKHPLLSKKIESGKFLYPETWDELIILRDVFKENKVKIKNKLNRQCGKEILHLFVLPNTVTDTRQFMTFFLELFWAHKGNVIFEDMKKITFQDKKVWGKYFIDEIVQSDMFKTTLDFMNGLVDGEAIPNPNIGGHHQHSILARRWLSKIELFPEDAKNLSKKEKFYFGIAPLPKVVSSGSSYSCLDLYCLGIIRGSLAPETGWMFADELLKSDTDKIRCIRRRGLPIVEKKNIYKSSHIKDALADDYSTIKKLILDESTSYSYFRTSDIPRYYELERLLASEIKEIFEKKSSKDIQDDIKKKIEEKWKIE